MRFSVVERGAMPSRGTPGVAFLEKDNWDDYTFGTQFHLAIADTQGDVRSIGAVKIASVGMGESHARTVLRSQFIVLDDTFFSVGQDLSYYEDLGELGHAVRDEVLTALRDIAADEAIFAIAIEERVTATSLFRDVSATTVAGQFRRFIRGEAKVEKYAFRYSRPGLRDSNGDPFLSFEVVPGSNPPTNIHALIGSNGVGKTQLLDQMARSMTYALPGDPHGVFEQEDGSADFASLVKISFSAFDDLESIENDPRAGGLFKIRQVGLHQGDWQEGDVENDLRQLMSVPPTLADILTYNFVKSFKRCVILGKGDRWIEGVHALDSDPLLTDLELERLVEIGAGSLFEAESWKVFKGLSSGHKIVLLTLTRLVELLEERTLVLMDEPEAHLHPPLLSAFVNALSTLLEQTNGVAIAATHSPVLLQEVPSSCVYMLDRSGDISVGRRPTSETFAESVGELTHDAFKLQVTQSGYHDRLRVAALAAESYQEVLDAFEGRLGAEGRAIARALYSMRPSGD